MIRFHSCAIIFMAVMNIDLDDHNRAATNTTLKNDNAEDNNHDNDSNDVTIMIPPTNMFQARFCQSVTEMPHWTRWMPLVCCSHFT